MLAILSKMTSLKWIGGAVMETTYLGLTPDLWRTVSIVAQGFLMCILVVTGIYQLLAIRLENKKNRTLEACDRYVHDAIIQQCLNRLSDARRNGRLEKNLREYRHDIVTILNYFDSLAIGIQQGIYDERMCRQFNELPLRGNVGRYLLNTDIVKKLDIDLASCKNLLLLNEKWAALPDALPVSRTSLLLDARLENDLQSPTNKNMGTSSLEAGV